MASQSVGGWPVGATVSVYLAAQLPPSATTPSGTAITSAVAGSGGTAAFSGLTEQVRYVALSGGRQVQFLIQGLSNNGRIADRDRINAIETAVGPSGSSIAVLEDAVLNVLLPGFGVVADGVTDDTLGLQGVIDAASVKAGATGGRVTVLLPAGKRFKISPTATRLRVALGDGVGGVGGTSDLLYALRMKSGVRLQIDGELYCPFVGSPSSNNWQIIVAATPADTNWEITGAGRINGATTLADPEWLHQGINPLGSTDFEIRGIEVVGCMGDSIRVDGSTSLGTGGGTFKEAQRFVIAGCNIHGGHGQAIEVNGSADYVVRDNHIHDHISWASTGMGAEAIWVNGSDFQVLDNDIRRYGSSISMQATGGMTRCLISGNVGDDELNYGSVITDAQIVGNTFTRIRGYGTEAETRLQIADNKLTITGSSNYGISVGSGVGGADLLVADNQCAAGIVISGAVAHAQVTGNRCGALQISAAALVIGNRASNMVILGADSLVEANYALATVAGDALTVSAPRVQVIANYLKTTVATQHAIFGGVGATVDDIMIADNTLYSASGNAINLNGPASKLRPVVRNNQLLSGAIAGVTGADVDAGTLLSLKAALGAFWLAETTDPAAPAADNVYFYARDNGAGKTQVVARFSSGAVQVIATQP